MKNRITKFQHQNTKNQTVILIFPRYHTYLLTCCVFTWKNDNTVPNVPTINRFLETTSGSELCEWYAIMCININDIHKIIMSVVSKQRTHT